MLAERHPRPEVGLQCPCAARQRLRRQCRLPRGVHARLQLVHGDATVRVAEPVSLVTRHHRAPIPDCGRRTPGVPCPATNVEGVA